MVNLLEIGEILMEKDIRWRGQALEYLGFPRGGTNSMTKKTINIMGSKYTIYYKVKESKDPALKNVLGFMDSSNRSIYIKLIEPDEKNLKDLEQTYRETLRHEIIHAFLYESGLDSSSGGTSSWARNEEMIDWIAIQYPKISKVFKKLDIEN
jgi:hypothetical protein